jgi:AcrR family transcriptional regulator
MARIRSGSGDPKSSMGLLWRSEDETRRGPKPRLRVQEVVRVAIELVDAEGVPALSMRRVAQRLGTQAMSLYSYVPSKAELVDLMIDAVLAELKPVDAGLGWRAKLEAIAYDNRALLQRHPWLLKLTTHRPVLGPNLIAKYDRELSALEGLGLSEIEMDLTLTLVNEYVWGAGRAVAEAPEVERESGMTDQDWWDRYGPLVEKVFDPEKYPVAARVGSAASEAYGGVHAPDRSFAFGLERVLDGIELFVRRRAGGP